MRVFISHSHKDKNIVRRIANDLRKNGLEDWLDEDMIAPGDAWADKINEALENSDAVLVIMSRNTAGSKSQTSEIAFAVATQRREQTQRVIPVLVDRQVDVPFFLRDVVYCDLSSEDQYVKNFHQLLEALSRPVGPRKDVREIDRRKIEAIKAEKQMLRRDVEVLYRKNAVRYSTVFGVMTTVIAVLITFSVGMSLTAVNWMVNIFHKWGFLLGILVGAICSLVAFFVARHFQRKSARREVGDGQ